MNTHAKKDIHIKLDPHVHKKFKMDLMEMGLTMQEAIEFFVDSFVEGEKSSAAIIDRMRKRQIRRDLAAVGIDKTGLKNGIGYVVVPRHRVLDEVDAEMLYDMIEEDDDDASKTPPPLSAQG